MRGQWFTIDRDDQASREQTSASGDEFSAPRLPSKLYNYAVNSQNLSRIFSRKRIMIREKKSMNWIERYNTSEINYPYHSAKSKFFQYRNIKFRLIFERNNFMCIFFIRLSKYKNWILLGGSLGDTGRRRTRDELTRDIYVIIQSAHFLFLS